MVWLRRAVQDQQGLPRRHLAADLAKHPADPTGMLSVDGDLHFHGLQDQQDLTRGDAIAGPHRELPDAAVDLPLHRPLPGGQFRLRGALVYDLADLAGQVPLAGGRPALAFGLEGGLLAYLEGGDGLGVGGQEAPRSPAG